MTTMTWLDMLQKRLRIDIDCVDPAEARRFLPFKPHDQTSNQRLIFEQITAPQNRKLLLKTVKEGGEEGWEVILNRMSALLCAKNIDNIEGRVLLQSSAAYAYDTDKIVAHARAYVQELEKLGVSKDRICIKIPATGPALNASPILLEEGIRTLATSIFCVAQAIAASQAKCLSISPYYNFPWFHMDRTQWPDVQDPALQHPMSPRLLQIRQVYDRLREEIGLEQPLMKPASFISAKEAMAMAELGCEHATIPEDILLQLSELDTKSAPPPGSAWFADNRLPSYRLAHLLKMDVLSGDLWDGRLPSTGVDYLANNGANLTKVIEADTVTREGLHLALEAFLENESQSRAAIEEAIRQLCAETSDV
ncbi:uncharacterized protein F5Z01DRAFT_691099 [Emericellopsis atlantica]|uniref:Transaldolase n=1 Tax=Emericellopsis atlantica TaxID=2614577 RepID=A0A9P8CMQ2_9HYPO|nr:uncharacterized protein F5Z01DRAFT_691099 [Emericellopsis atlantica]KAG9252357.1 hypothetical protein F5Z01DRAFT_691099 [Emericellopsis atlantica]